MIGAIAEGQLGNVTREQLVGAGIGVAAIDHWGRTGRLRLRHRAVYALAHLSLPPFSREMAAVLACGSEAILSHASAAFLWGIRQEPEVDPVDVTVVGRNVRPRPRICVHHVGALAPHDVARHNLIPVTSPARTLIDIAATLDDRELERGLHEALVTKLVTLKSVRSALKVYPHRRGCARLAELAGESRTTVTRSGGEEALLGLIRKSGLPHPQVNARIGTWSVDFLWPEQRLAVELDGADFHRTRWSVERDHRKDLAFRNMQIDLLRFSGRQVTREPETVLVTIARAMG